MLLDDEGGTENNIKYDKEFLNGKFTHLAIVENPRYERANIVVNSKTEILNKGIETIGINNDKWITVHPNGDDEKGRHLLIQDGEDVKEAMQRQWGVYDKRQAKLKSDDKPKDKKDEKKKEKTSKIYDNLLNDSGLIEHLKESIKAQKAENPNAQVGDTVIDSDRYISLYTDKLTTEEYKNFNADKAEDLIFKKLNEMEKEAGFKEAKQEPKQEDKGNILEGGIKETKDKYGRTNFAKGNKWANVTSNGGRSDSWIAAYGLTHKSGVSWEAEKGVTEKQLLNSRHFKTEKGARKWALEQLKRITSDNSKEQEMTLIEKLKKLIKEVQEKGAKMDTKTRILSILNEKEVDEDVIEEVENEFDEIDDEEKAEIKNKKAKNEKVDKRKLIDEVAGMMKSAGCSDEIIRTAIKDMEKEAYDKSEDNGADNKKAKNEDEEKDEKEVKEVEKDVKKDVDNKCKNSVYNATDYFNKVNEVYNSSCKAGVQNKYETQADRLEAGNKY